MKRKWLVSLIFLVVIVGLLIYLLSHKDTAVKDELVVEAVEDSTAYVLVPNLEFGIPIDSFTIEEGIIRRNQTLSTLLNKYDVSFAAIDKIAVNSDTVFNLRRIKSGNAFKIYFTNDTNRIAKYFVYKHTPMEYVVMELEEPYGVRFETKEATERMLTAEGIINTSLWNALKDNNDNPNLANDLSEIYAWTIDFFGLNKGDSYKAIYNELFVDTVSVGIKDIMAAQFVHGDSTYYAFLFFQDSVWSYFDIKGQSLRKAFLKAPLRFNRISSHFSNSRFHPVLKIYRPHHGIDYAAPSGTPVYTVGDGKVIKMGWDRGGGNFVKVKHNSTYATVYMHLKGFAKGIHTGKVLRQGDLIGYVGSTGLSTGPHLDFRFYRNDKPINPLKVEAPPVEPVKPELKAKFDSVKTFWLDQLNPYEVSQK